MMIEERYGLQGVVEKMLMVLTGVHHISQVRLCALHISLRVSDFPTWNCRVNAGTYSCYRQCLNLKDVHYGLHTEYG